MASAEQLAHNLLQWWHSSSRTPAIPEWLASDVTFDSGLELLRGNELIRRVENFHSWEDIAILTSFGTSTQAVLVFEGFDQVTLLRRRAAWIVSIIEGKITSILAVDMISNAPIPGSSSS
jgi:hypothetical protein